MKKITIKGILKAFVSDNLVDLLDLFFTDGFLHSFSLYYTISKLIAPGTTDEIACIHGIRGIATLALLVAHKFLPVAVMPYTNRVKITEVSLMACLRERRFK